MKPNKIGEVSKSQAIDEIVRCADDPVYFIEKYARVQHATRGLVKFKLYDYQKETIKRFLAHDRVIINKARQLGFTTLTAAFIVWLILFHNDKSVLCVSIKAEVSKNMMKMIKVILTGLPDWMYLADFTTKRAHMIGLSNGSWVKSVARSDDVGRSESLSLLVIDEAALIRGMSEIWKSLKSTVSTGGKIFAMSTPKGMAGTGEWFYKTYTDAVVGTNEWNHLLVNWFENPEYAVNLRDEPLVPGGKTSDWFEKFTKDMSKAQIAQELLTTFVDTGDTFFDSMTIKYYLDNAKDPLDKTFHDKGLWIWKYPKENEQYIVAADASMGGGLDNSTAIVMNKHLEVYAEYQGQLRPDEFAEFLIDLATKYNNAWLCPEGGGTGGNGAGNVCAYCIKNLGYQKIVYLNKDLMLVDRWIGESQGLIPGVPMHVGTRAPMLAKLEEHLRKKNVIAYSKRFVRELNTFAIINGKPQAMKGVGSHDDLIMAMAIAVFMRDIIPEFGGIFYSSDAASLIKSIKKNSNEFDSSAWSAKPAPWSPGNMARQHHKLKKDVEMQGWKYLPLLYKV